jgi:hypothetical protein
MPNPVAAGLPNPASYDTSTPGVVVDGVTHLMWQRTPSAQTYDWADAQTYCEALSLAGHDDWRLPTEIELYSLVDFTRSGPAIDTTAFPGTPSSQFWSSTPSASTASFAWYVNFPFGDVNTFATTSAFTVRCVR